MKNLFFILFFIVSLFARSQDFKKVDLIVNQYPSYFNSIEAFANKVNTDFNTDLEKVRAVYYWVSNHIFYDYAQANRTYRRRTYYESEADLERQLKLMAEQVLRRKRGVCEGYAQLTRFVLQDLQINCKVIKGYAKNDYREIGVIKEKTNHAWNAVFINNKWHLLDATWSTGNDKDEPGKFDFDDFYFLTNPELMIYTHYAEDTKWLLLDQPMSKSAFFYTPLFYDYYHKSGLKFTKIQGLIKSSDEITILFDEINENVTYSYFLEGSQSKYSQPLRFEKQGNKYITHIPFRKGRKTGLTIFAQGKACVAFRII